jgi:hypothetical protein
MPHARLIDLHDQCAQLERHINAETLRQLRRLEVRPENGQIVVRGAAPSYYVRQVAEQTAMDLVPVNELDLNISVDSFGEAGRVPHGSRSRRMHPELALAQ